MKKAIVIRQFTDKNTGVLNAIGKTIELSNERFNELLQRGYIVPELTEKVEVKEVAKNEIKPKKEKKVK